ncbi:MAG TPA: hypothetical protein VHI93_02665, partial [Candidatus Thermoplasmatota archaeon]|nr:hypothetical protein [Candidatus Thermoplasmatota archaeon]
MRPFLLAACLTTLLAAPLATAGTAKDPEISDPARDADPANALDLTGVYVDASDPESVAFHFQSFRSTASQETGACSGAECLAITLAFTVEFVVLAPNGTLAPAPKDYAATQVTLRSGGPAPLRGTVAYLNATGWANNVTAVPVQGRGRETVVTVPRTHVGVAVPAGQAPGAYRLTGLFAHASPQLCHPTPEDPTETAPSMESCMSIPRPVPTGSAIEARPHWDVAPDIGHGADFVFPAPPADTQSPPPASAPAPRPTPAPPPPPATSPATSPPADPPSPQPSPPKATTTR